MSLKSDILEHSFRLVAPRGPQLVARFYEELFRRHRSVKPLFKGVSSATQQKKLLAALKLVIQNVRCPKVLIPLLEEMGARHIAYGVQPAHYEAVATTLLDVFAEFAGRAWTPVVRDAWAEALTTITSIMLTGAHKPSVHTPQKGPIMARSKPSGNSPRRSAGPRPAIESMHFIKTALDGASTNILLCDRQYRVTYINRAAQQKLTEMEAEIRKALPQFRANAVVGSCIDSFHKIPSHQRRILEDPTNLPHRADITLGPLTLNLLVGAVIDESGEYLGNTLEWEDVTAKRKMETEMIRLKTSLDNARTNVIVCDRNYTIVYVNKASETTLRKLEFEIRKLLPAFAVDKLVGSSIDQYHQDPRRQRRLLDDPKNLPYRTEIKLGPLTLDLNASAILSDKGEYLGNVVEWADITAQRKAQDEVQRLIAAAVEGKLSERAPAEEFEGFYRDLAEGINKMMDALVIGLTKVVTAVKDSADHVSTGAKEISVGTEDLSQRTSEQASALEETSSAMEEMTSTVKQNADNAKQANDLAIAARDVAEKGGSVTTQAVSAMGEINKSSKKIADIITVIDEIAFQTNLLALNAAVEAARAGEHGRGFAVVAAEVRNLAGRSATAAKEIKLLINESIQRVADGSKLVDHSGKTLEEIVTSVKRVTAIVAEITAASQEQSAGIEQVNKAIIQMDQTTQQNAALVEESAAASQTLDQHAARMLRLMGSFKMVEGQVAEMTPIQEEHPILPEGAKTRKPTGTLPPTTGQGPRTHNGNGHPPAPRGKPYEPKSAKTTDGFEEF